MNGTGTSAPVPVFLSKHRLHQRLHAFRVIESGHANGDMQALMNYQGRVTNMNRLLLVFLLWLGLISQAMALASTTATVVYGQGGSFTTRTANNGGISANSLNGVGGLVVDSTGGLYVADFANSRILHYPAGSTTADWVSGQGGSFTTREMGLSEFLCKREFRLRLAVMDSVPEADGKLAKRGFPIFDGHGPFLTDISESQVEQFDQGVIIGEEAPGLG